MKESLYVAAVTEAKRFLDLAWKLEKECDLAGEIHGIEPFYYGCKQTAALKRASMDLTRALADLRANGTRS